MDDKKLLEKKTPALANKIIKTLQKNLVKYDGMNVEFVIDVIINACAMAATLSVKGILIAKNKNVSSTKIFETITNKIQEDLEQSSILKSKLN